MKRLSVFWALLTFLVFYHSTGAHGDIHSMLRQIDIEENDPDISEQEKRTLDQYRDSLVKQQILKMLGLERPPNVSDVQDIPKQMLQSVLSQTIRDSGDAPEHEADANKQIIVIAQPDSAAIESENPEIRTSKSMRFHTNVKLNSISSVTLVIRRNPQILTDELLKKQRLLIARIAGYPNRHSYLFGHPKIIKTSGNWVKLDITSIIKSKGDDTVLTNVTIEVLCEECGISQGFRSSRNRRPFLLLNMKTTTKARESRSANCGGSCSLQTYKVNFAKMGYPFVFFPKEFSLNYCKGLCRRPDKRILFMSLINLSNPNKTIPNGHKCCVVSEWKSLSVLYKNDKGIQRVFLSKATATKCHCT